MKITISLIFLTAVSAFVPQSSGLRTTVDLSAVGDRKAFLAAAAATLFTASAAHAMDQQDVTAPTEQWETGKPTPAAEQDRMERFSQKRTQLDSNFAPIKRLNLERKSPVVRHG